MVVGAKRDPDWLDKFVPQFLKIDHNFELARSILMKLVAFGIKYTRFEIMRVRGPGKFCSARMSRFKVGHVDTKFWD